MGGDLLVLCHVTPLLIRAYHVNYHVSSHVFSPDRGDQQVSNMQNKQATQVSCQNVQETPGKNS